MTIWSDTVAFLTARLDEDEAVARDATAGPWSYGEEDQILAAEPHPASIGDWSSWYVAQTSYDDQSGTVYNSAADGEFIARFDPARVLIEIAAKRAIIRWSESHYGELDEAVAALAAVYADHPDYRQEWKP